MLAVIEGGRPAETGLAGGTGRVLPIPIDRELLHVKAGALAGVPVIIEARGPEQIDAVVLPTLDQECGVQNAGIDDMSRGQGGPGAAVHHGSWGSLRPLKPGPSWCRCA